ncbi:AraC family transcriptional regulator [Lacinutrix neustonica]|uniref:AraC family transcriptional regulator n=1 Tax=Lacinutrix neustonica TaxID=2980107 RepID=A0A9E8MUD0_9FLAO|nr:helix-turn-helix domain-containing protein [Lacinutrix neustonica]WAC01693.1 AraC family transcriptional regulator [Lacinutrix neustonica]
MKNIIITAENTADTVKQLQEVIGGHLVERWGEFTLSVDNDIAKGSIRFITFDWGGSLLEYDIIFFEEVVLKLDTSQYNPIHFTYCLNGFCEHRFEMHDQNKRLEQFQSVIITSKDGGYNYNYFPKAVKLEINVIQINRVKFINKRLNDASQLNKKLYEVFHDTDHENTFSYFGTYNLKLADRISALRKIKQRGIMRLLLIEGQVYQILALHMTQHNKDTSNKNHKSSLTKRELNTVRTIAQNIATHVSKDYNLDDLSYESGLSQAKLQEGFKLLYTRTVTEYIRHARLEEARDLMNTTDMNISEIVYTIGFSSRSYFSKIFKKKYKISPSKFLKSKQMVLS